MNKSELLMLSQSADQSEDMDEVDSLYQQILSEPGLSFKLSSQQINDTRWNRAINLVDIANWFLNTGYEGRSQPTRAHTQIMIAIEEITQCRKNYKSTSDIATATAFLSELEANKDIIERALEERSALLPSLSP